MTTRNLAIGAALAIAIGLSGIGAQAPPVYTDASAPIERRVADLLAAMTLDEKMLLIGGDKSGFATNPIERLGIPAMTMTDGPVGVRWERSTAFPAGIAMAATWDPDLVGRIAAAIAREAKAHGRDVLLGPCVNIQRVPQGGRNFESFGEDPYLAARMAVAYVRSVQQQRVVATPKHFAANNQETNRMTVNARVDERALREIYFPAFEAAVREANAWAVMSAYNKLNGAWCSENPGLLDGLLKREWAFGGLVMSDWGAVHSAVPTAKAGCDLEMPQAEFMNQKSLMPAIRSGEVAAAVLDDKVRRILRVMFISGVFDRHGQPAPGGALDTPAHRELAREAAIDSTVLLKNDRGLLPLDVARLGSVAVIGPNAAVARTGGGGSSRVAAVYSISPLDGLRSRLGSKVVYAQGCGMRGDPAPLEPRFVTPEGGPPGAHGLRGEYFANVNLQGQPAATRTDDRIDWSIGSEPTPAELKILPAGLQPQNFSVRWTGSLTPERAGEYEFSLRADDGARLYVGDGLLIDGWSAMPRTGKQATIALDAGRAYPIKIEYFQKTGGASIHLGWRPADSELLREAVAAAVTSDAAVVFAGLSAAYEAEGSDRDTLALPANQERLIQSVAAANHRTIVVLNSGAPVLMESWIGRVPAVLEAWYPGQEDGNAIAAVLTGDRNPSGKLPATFLKRWEDSPAHGHFPGENGIVDYAEGVFVGYRHFDRANIEPAFPFGHGLSYTTFAYSGLAITPGSVHMETTDRAAVASAATVQVTFDVQNTGGRAGSEVAQVYVHDDHASVPRPVKELKGFHKVSLRAGERQRVTVTLDRRSLAFYDVTRHDWVVEPGTFEVLVGSSSRDIRLRGKFEVK